MNHLCENVLSIVLLYVRLNKLIPFLISHDLNFGMKFKYLTEDWGFKILNTLRNVDVDGMVWNKNNNVFDFVSITIYNYGRLISEFDGTKIKEILDQCVNIKSITFVNFYINNFGFMNEYKKVRTIKFYGCGWNSNSCNFLFQCVNLRKLVFSCSINNNNAIMISRVYGLKILKIKRFNYGKLSCVNLRKLRIENTFRNTFNFDAIDECVNLRVIKFVNSWWKYCKLNVGRLKRLRRVVFLRCDDCQMDLRECQKLECAKFISCNNINVCLDNNDWCRVVHVVS